MSLEQEFRNTVYQYYHTHPREVDMPWRVDYNPYYVLLSELMLQQTQVNRVVEYFNTFISVWPRLEDLANASLFDVLFYWQGLGYNRRAKFLHLCAKTIVSQHNAIIPQDIEDLQKLPGIGVYTSAAIMTFAFNKAVVVVETNIRRAIIHWFFSDETNIKEQLIRNKTAEVLDFAQPRIWNWALMDYGSSLNTHVENPNRKSRIYRRQSKFEGSNRQVRGTIVRVLVSKVGRQNKKHLCKEVEKQIVQQKNSHCNFEKIDYNLKMLEEEGLIACEKNMYYIPK